MKILTSPSSGSIAGTTYSHNRAGQYTRNRRAPVQPVGTGRRGIIRSAFGAASSAWAALTPTVQNAWGAYANGHPYTDSLGQSIKLTGHQMYVAVNTQLLNVGLAQSSVIPVSDATIAPVVATFTAVHAGAITLTLAAGGIPADHVCIALSAPQSGGRSYCKTFWQQITCLANLVTAQILTTAYTAQFGAIAAGQRIFYKLTPVNAYGVTGVPNIGMIVVT
jgi:hypothetical protein